MNRLIEAVILSRYTPKNDGSISLTFNTQELDPQKVAQIHSMRNNYGVLYFKAENQLTEQELKDFDEIELEYNGQSKSKRLKNVLYRLWEQSNKSVNEKDFYANELEKIITHYKNKLE